MNTATKATAYDLVNGSFGRCANSNGFFDSFYSILKGSHPDIANMFAETDFTKQNELLRIALELMLMFDHGSDAAKQVMERIRESHSRHQLNVPPQLYDYWLDSLMKACAKHDTEFTPEHETAWRDVLSKGINYIKSGYDDGAEEAECMAYLNFIDPDLETVARSWRFLPDSVRAEVMTKIKSAT